MTEVARRALMAAAALAVYGAGASWVVRQAGQSYRDALRAAGARAIAKAEAIPPARLAPPADRPEVAVAPRPAAPPVAKPDPAPARPVEVVHAPASKRARPAPKAKAGPKPRSPLWADPEVKKAWDLDHMTPDDEARFGQTMDALVRQLNPTSQYQAANVRLQEAAEPLREKVGSKDIPYTFTVLESGAFNAFSVPGGFIYVNRGLLDALGADEDYAIQFVVAHEMAHVELHHALLCLRKPAVRALANIQGLPEMGTADVLYNQVIPIGYPKEMEYEADRRALEWMEKIGRGRHESLVFLEKLAHRAKADDFLAGQVAPVPGRDASILDNHLRAHVGVKSRLARAKEFFQPPPPHPAAPAR